MKQDEKRVREVANNWNAVRENFNSTIEEELAAIYEWALNMEQRINGFCGNSLSINYKKIMADLEADISKITLDSKTLYDRQDKLTNRIFLSCKQVKEELKGGLKDWSQGIRDQIDDR